MPLKNPAYTYLGLVILYDISKKVRYIVRYIVRLRYRPHFLGAKTYETSIDRFLWLLQCLIAKNNVVKTKTKVGDKKHDIILYDILYNTVR